jgi:hypothetical protein
MLIQQYFPKAHLLFERDFVVQILQTQRKTHIHYTKMLERHTKWCPTFLEWCGRLLKGGKWS